MAVAAAALALERVLTDVRERWGQGSIVRLEHGGPTLMPTAERRAVRRQQPAWWPLVLPDGAVMRPGVVEVVAPPGSGRLTLALAWLAAARPALAALVVVPDPSVGIPFAPSVAQLGVDLERLILVRPPRALDAVAVLLRSEAFDVVVCALPPGTRVSTTFAGKLASLASRGGTTLFLLSTLRQVKRYFPPRPKRFVAPFTVVPGEPHVVPPGATGAPPSPGVLASFADYRLTLSATRRLWQHAQLVGLKLTIRTERARGAGEVPGASLHELTVTTAPHGPSLSWRSMLEATPETTPLPAMPLPAVTRT